MIYPHETLAQLTRRVELIAPHESDSGTVQAMWVRPSTLIEVLAVRVAGASPSEPSRETGRSEVTALRSEIREKSNALLHSEAQVKRLTAELASALGEVKRLRKQTVGAT